MRKERKQSVKSGKKVQGFKHRKQTLSKASHKKKATTSRIGINKCYKSASTVTAHGLKDGKTARYIVCDPSYNKYKYELLIHGLTDEDGLQIEVGRSRTKGGLVGKGSAKVAAHKRNPMPTRPRPVTGKPQTPDTSDQSTQGQSQGGK